MFLNKKNKVDEALNLLSEDSSLLIKNLKWEEKFYNKKEIYDIWTELNTLVKTNLGSKYFVEMYYSEVYSRVRAAIYKKFFIFKVYANVEGHFFSLHLGTCSSAGEKNELIKIMNKCCCTHFSIKGDYE